MIPSSLFNSIRAGHCQPRREAADECAAFRRNKWKSELPRPHRDPTAAGIARAPPCTTSIPCAVSKPGSDLQLQSLASFFLGALFQCCFARKLYAALVVDTDAFDPNHVAHLGHVFGAIHSEIRQLGNMHQPILARKNFNERTEFLRGDHATLVGLTDLDFACHSADDFLRT